jgi:hypothetical protein
MGLALNLTTNMSLKRKLSKVQTKRKNYHDSLCELEQEIQKFCKQKIWVTESKTMDIPNLNIVLNSELLSIPSDDAIVIIEDEGFLKPKHFERYVTDFKY